MTDGRFDSIDEMKVQLELMAKNLLTGLQPTPFVYVVPALLRLAQEVEELKAYVHAKVK